MFIVLGREVDRRPTAEAGADIQPRIKLRIGSRSWIGMVPGESFEQKVQCRDRDFPLRYGRKPEWGYGASCGTWNSGST